MFKAMIVVNGRRLYGIGKTRYEARRNAMQLAPATIGSFGSVTWPA